MYDVLTLDFIDNNLHSNLVIFKFEEAEVNSFEERYLHSNLVIFKSQYSI